MKISQSLIKDIKSATCPKYLFFNYVEDRKATEHLTSGKSKDLGNFFELKLIGENVSENSLEDRIYKKSSNKKELYKHFEDILVDVEYAKKFLEDLGVVITKKQVSYETDLLKGSADIEFYFKSNPKQVCIGDVKYTQTAIDNVWDGWGDVETKFEAHIQACQYTLLRHELTGEWTPFYFFVFGKGWGRAIKMQITPERMDMHKNDIGTAANYVSSLIDTNFKGQGNYVKCHKCPYFSICEDRVILPEIEIITI